MHGKNRVHGRRGDDIIPKLSCGDVLLRQTKGLSVRNPHRDQAIITIAVPDLILVHIFFDKRLEGRIVHSARYECRTKNIRGKYISGEKLL